MLKFIGYVKIKINIVPNHYKQYQDLKHLKQVLYNLAFTTFTGFIGLVQSCFIKRKIGITYDQNNNMI